MSNNLRYPGPQPFREADEPLFHGRRRETRALFDLVMAQSPVVLFAKSGMGKTSLVQAGLFPRLRRSPLGSVPVRLNRVGVPILEQVLGAIMPGLPPTTLLWEALTAHNREHRGTLLLVFDQFEELFTLYDEPERAAFIGQLADVVNAFLPEKIRGEIRARLADGTLSDAEATALEQPPRVKVLLSIRADLLHWLHDISDEIPSILRNRYELGGLGTEEAREAITRPAEQPQEGGDFASPAFGWDDGAVGQILGFLGKKQAGKQGEIETFQLQLICGHIEQKIIDEHPASDRVVVGPGFYGGEAGIEAVLGNFYEKTLSKIADPAANRAARRLTEDHLIKNQRRVAVDGATILLSHGVAPEVLATLVEARLLRRDTRETGDYYELSHDTLMPPILRSKENWDRAETERAAREAEARARAETRKRRFATRLAVAAGCLAFLAIIAFVFAWRQYRAAERARAEVFRNALQSQRSLAQVLKTEGKYAPAIGQLDQLMVFSGDIEPALRDSIDRLRADWRTVAGQVAAAENFTKKGELREALLAYETAQRTSPDARVENLARQAAEDLEARFRVFMFNADRQVQAGQFELAIGNLEAALRLKPGDAAAAGRLAAAKK